MKILKLIKGVFVKPVKKYYFGKKRSYVPVVFNPTIFSINTYKYNKYRFNLFGYDIRYGLPFYIQNNELGWKDKFTTPRFERAPSFNIFFFNYQFSISYHSPDSDDDRYYEMILWWLYYCDKDIVKAKNTWGWRNNGISTWDDNYVIGLDKIREEKLKQILG